MAILGEIITNNLRDHKMARIDLAVERDTILVNPVNFVHCIVIVNLFSGVFSLSSADSIYSSVVAH